MLRMSRLGILHKPIADVVHYGHAECGRTTFNAIIISNEHALLMKTYPNGSVRHTRILELSPIAMHLSKDARAKYSDHALNTWYDDRVEG